MAFKFSLKRSVLPILAFGAPLVAIAFVQYRWLLELQNRSEMIEMQQYREAARHARSLLVDEMTSARLDVLPAVGHGDLLADELDPIANVLEKGYERFEYVDRFFIWTASMRYGEALFYEPGGGFVSDPTRLFCLPEDVWTLPESNRRWGEFSCVGEHSTTCQVVIHWVLDDEEKTLLGVAGFMVDLDFFARDFLPKFAASALIPSVQDLLDDREMTFTLVDANDGLIVGADDSRRVSSSDVEVGVSFTLPSEGVRSMQVPRWHMSVGGVHAGGVQELIRRGAVGNLAIVGAGIVVLALGSGLMARSSAKEAKLSDLRSRFISGISHELKTPLANIRLYSEMLELGRVTQNKERTRFYRSLRQQAEILGDMLEDILDFSRLESEENVTRFERCELRDILEEAVEMREGARTPHSVDVKLPETLPQVHGNHSALVRVVYNLLDNASKYSGPDDETITLEAYQRNGTVTIEVGDRGVGISPEDMPHVFERFYRGRTSDDVKGAGLGLSIAQSVVSSHGGRIELESEPGKGSRFKVVLPVAPREG